MWFQWLQAQDPTTTGDMLVGTPYALERRNLTLDEQRKVWKEWSNPIEIRILTCALDQVGASASRRGCVAPKLEIAASSGHWWRDESALDAIVAAGVRFVPEQCEVNAYDIRVRFEPIGDVGETVEALGALLRSSDRASRAKAAGTLGIIQTQDERVVKLLNEALSDEATEVRQAAEHALARRRQ